MSEDGIEVIDLRSPRPITVDPELDFPTKLETDVSRLGPVLTEVLKDQKVAELLEPLKKLSPWKYDHSLDTARMMEAIDEELIRLNLPHADVRDAVRAALLHDIGVSDIENPEIVNLPRGLTDEERKKMGAHASLGAGKVDNPTIRALIGSHHDYDTFQQSQPLTSSSDPLDVSKQVLAAIDIRHAMQDPKRPYLKSIFTDDEVRDEIRKKVPTITDKLLNSILQLGNAVLSTPVSDHIPESPMTVPV